jgi:hypothetical protein
VWHRLEKSPFWRLLNILEYRYWELPSSEKIARSMSIGSYFLPILISNKKKTGKRSSMYGDRKGKLMMAGSLQNFLSVSSAFGHASEKNDKYR